MARLTAAERQQRAASLQATYEYLATRSPYPITASDLARETGWTLSAVYRLLKGCAWWTPARAAAARQEHLRRLHEHLEGQAFPGHATILQASRAKSQAWATALFDAFGLLQQQFPVVTPADLARALGMNVRRVKARLAESAWWTEALAAAARAEMHRRKHLKGHERAEASQQVSLALLLPDKSWRRLLRPEQVWEIRRRLADGESPTTLARVFEVHKNTIYRIQQGRLWGGLMEERASQKAEVAALPPVVRIVEADTASVILPPALWRALKAPTWVALYRRAHDRALVLLPTTGAGYLVSLGPLPSIAVGPEALQRLGLSPGEYRWSMPSKQRFLRLSDVPDPQRATMIPIAEACQILGVSKQGFSQLSAAGHFQVYYDAVRKRQVVSRAAVLARQLHSPAAHRSDGKPGEAPS